MKIQDIAKACHEVNRTYCAAIGDESQPPWTLVPQWQKDSSIKGVEFALSRIHDVQPQDSHQSWLEEKRRDGWKYGPLKDATKKEHPCFVPYEELPAAQRAKDAIFIAVVKGLASL